MRVYIYIYRIYTSEGVRDTRRPLCVCGCVQECVFSLYRSFSCSLSLSLLLVGAVANLALLYLWAYIFIV